MLVPRAAWVPMGTGARMWTKLGTRPMIRRKMKANKKAIHRRISSKRKIKGFFTMHQGMNDNIRGKNEACNHFFCFSLHLKGQLRSDGLQ